MGCVTRYVNGQIYWSYQLCSYIDIDNISTKIKINSSGRHYLHYVDTSFAAPPPQPPPPHKKIPSSWSSHLPRIFWDDLEIELHILWYILYWHTLPIYYLILPLVFVVQWITVWSYTWSFDCELVKWKMNSWNILWIVWR